MSDRKQNLPQLYRFCFLMLGDLRKAQEVFNTTLREAAVRAAQGELPKESFWLFREARWRCLEASKMDLQPESLQIDEHDIAPQARVTDQAARARATGNLDFRRPRSSADRAGAFLSRRVQLP